MRSETEPWWRQAQADRDTARLTVRTAHAYVAAWFSQQAAEKALKALYIEQRGPSAPYTHDLHYLGGAVGVVSALEPDLLLLNRVFDIVRYPDPNVGRAPVDEITPAMATAYVAAMERLIAWIDTQLPSSSTRP